jgi:UDP-glucose 4-epimerase
MEGEMNAKSILVTGGTGSFGVTFIKRALDSGIQEIRCLSRDVMKQDQLREMLPDPRLNFYLGDVRDFDSIIPALDGMDYVFHAAALKQVPSSEQFPYEYVKTNVLGSQNLIKAMQRCNTGKGVFLSTDKAVEPVNMMGISKAAMEKLVYGAAKLEKLAACVTRYGIVMGSRGSVLPKFISSVKNDSPLHVTQLEMTRFMMSLTDSVDLVIHALETGGNGDLFIQKAPAASLQILVQALKLLYPKKNIEVLVAGPRPGEKIHETLLTSEEVARASEDDVFFQVKPVWASETTKMNFADPYTSANTNQLSPAELAKLIESTPETRALL